MLRYLDPAILARLGHLSLRARRSLDGARVGHHRATRHGSSVEFAEHKVYTPGDDLRRLDWKAFAKLDRYYVRRYEHESELCGYFVVDASGSMAYGRTGTPPKLDYACFLAATLAYQLGAQDDASGLWVARQEGTVWVPPRPGIAHALELARTLEGVHPHGRTDLGDSLGQLGEAARRRGVVVLLSDLFDDAERILAGLLRLRARRHRVMVLHVLDPDELEFPFEGLSVFESMEDERKLLVDARAARSAFQREMQAFIARFRARCHDEDVGYHLLSTARPIEAALAEVLGA